MTRYMTVLSNETSRNMAVTKGAQERDNNGKCSQPHCTICTFFCTQKQKLLSVECFTDIASRVQILVDGGLRLGVMDGNLSSAAPQQYRGGLQHGGNGPCVSVYMYAHLCMWICIQCVCV